jgi:capsular exopolysaccharide synthesis family protein
MIERHEQSDLDRLRIMLKRHWLLILLAMLAGGGSAFAFSSAQQKQYTATASLLFRDSGLEQRLFGSDVFQPSVDPAREAQTNVRLASLDTIAERTAGAMGQRATAKQVSDSVAVAADGASNVVSIKATGPDPSFAANLANEFARQYIAFRQDADRAKIRAAYDLVQRRLTGMTPEERRGAAGESLTRQARQLRDLSSLQTGNAELVQTAKPPSSPSAPRPRRNSMLGGALGLLVGALIGLLFERLDRRLKEPDELQDVYDLPLLGKIPESRAYARAEGGRGEHALPSAEAEAFRMLRARLRYCNVDQEISSVLISSPSSGEGKTTVAWNLAAAAAGAGRSRVVLIEADLRRPRLARDHGLQATPGLSELLTQALPFGDVIQHVPVSPSGNGNVPAETLEVIVAGEPPPNPAALIESRRLERLLEAFSHSYDLVIIDTPPVAIVADAIPLLSQVNGVIVVSRLGRTSVDTARRFRKQLEELRAPLLGVVANGAKRDRGDDSYYGYESGGTRGRKGDTADVDT